MKIIYVLILCISFATANTAADRTPIDTLYDFAKGYTEGINQEKQFNDLYDCVKTMGAVVYYYNAVWNKIKKMSPQRPVEIFEVIALCVTAVRKTMSHLSNYQNIYIEVERLFFGHISIVVTFFFVCSNVYRQHEKIFKEIHKFIKSRTALERGTSLGIVTYEVLFNSKNVGDKDFGLKQFLTLVDNFFMQVINNPTYNEFSDCLLRIPNIYQVFIEGIKKIIENDFKDIKKLIEGIVALVYTMIEALASAKTCSKLPVVLSSLGGKLYNVTVKELVNRFTNYFMYILSDFIISIDAMQSKSYDMVGRSFGHIAFYLIYDRKKDL